MLSEHDPILIQVAVANALITNTRTGLSLFSPARLKRCLRDKNMHIGKGEVTVLALNTLDNHQDTTPEVYRLRKALLSKFAFRGRFINTNISAVNEYSLRSFCEAQNVYYPESIRWESIISEIIKLQLQRTYPDMYMEYINAVPTSTPNKENMPMNTEQLSFNRPVTVGITHTVNNRDVKTMSKQDLFDCIVSVKNSIRVLNPMKKESKAVDKEIKKQKKTIKAVIKHLDAKL